jgi:pimeloyl-ACP methyl ester carboxylesterase
LFFAAFLDIVKTTFIEKCMFREMFAGGEKAVAHKRSAEHIVPPEVRVAMPLDKQWGTRDRLTFQSQGDKKRQEIEVADLVPNQEALAQLPVMVVPGFTEGPETLAANMQGLALNGMRTLTYDAPSGISSEHFRPEKLSPEQFAEYEIKKAWTLLKVMEKKSLDRTDAVAHSEGCIHLVLAALERPDQFRNIVLVNPGGMVGDDNLIALVRRAYEHWVAERHMVEAGHYAVGSVERAQVERNRNFLKSLKQGLPSARAMACSEIHEILRSLKKLGIGISIIHSVDDILFPMDRVQETTSSDEVDGFYSVRGGHNDFFLKPEDWTLLVHEALSALDQKYPASSPEAPGKTIH